MSEAPPSKAQSSCPSCGCALEPDEQACPRCAYPVVTGAGVTGRRKSRTVAVLLAVFLAFWTWLYTYRKDWLKFWLGLAADTIGALLFLLTESSPWVYTGLGLVVAVWAWSVVDVVVKCREWYWNF